MAIIKYISTEVKRKLDYKCIIASTRIGILWMIGYTIQIKLFGIFWISYKNYHITCYKSYDNI